MRHPLPTVLLTAACALAAAAPASADSIAYVKAGDVYLATSDGAREQRVTHSGGYSYVSQADDGTMVALAPGERLHKLSRTGDVLADIPTFVSDGAAAPGPVTQFHGPFAPEISPDGTKVAFEWFNKSYNNGSGCDESSVPPCQVLTSSQGVGITYSDRFTGFEEFGLLTGWIGPQWLGNDKLLRSFANGVLNEDGVFNDVGPGKGDSAIDRWAYDESGGLLYEMELTRDRKAMAAIGGWNDEQLRVYRTTVEPFGAKDWDMKPFAKNDTPLIEGCFALGNPGGGKFESLSFSPDGRRLAYGEADGTIWTVEVPDVSGGCANHGANVKVLEGRFPHWGPADIPPASEFKPPKGTTVTKDPGDHDAKPPVEAGTKLAFALGKAPKLARALRTGVVVKVSAPAAGEVAVTARRGRTAIAKGRATALRPGAVSVRLRFTKAGKRALRRARTAKLELTATAAGTTAKARMTLRR